MLLASFLTAAALALPVATHDGECPSRLDFTAGCYLASENTIWVQDLERNRIIYYHELGHAFDAQRMDAGERHAFSCLHAARHPVDGSRCGDPWTDDDLTEVFADAYASCAAGARPGSDEFLNGSDYEPTARQHRAACRFINRAAD